MNDDPGRGEREIDTLTIVLACALAAIILGAVGYGVVNSSKMTTAIPSMSPGSQKAAPAQQPIATTGSR